MSELGLASLLVLLFSVWLGVFWIKPAVARARVAYQITRVRDRIVDGVLDGYIDVDSDRAQAALFFCDILAEHPRKINLGDALAARVVIERAGPKYLEGLRRIRRAREEEAQHTAAGTRILQESEQEMDRILVWHLLHGSMFWWILEPLSAISKILRKLDRRPGQVNSFMSHPDLPEIATEVRRAHPSLFRQAPNSTLVAKGARGIFPRQWSSGALR